MMRPKHLDPAMIRAMANTLADHNVDPDDENMACLELMKAGFLANDITIYWDAVITMALIRRRKAS